MHTIDRLLKNAVSDSAYMVNISRNQANNLYNDRFSICWIPDSHKDEVISLWELYTEKVYPYDDLELGIRTKYFLNHLENAIKKYKDLIFVNIASGFTSYQYLVDAPIETIELDYKEIIEKKEKRAKNLIDSEVIPNRTTHYFSCDLDNTDSRINTFNEIKEIVGKKNTIVFCEGLFYYLKKNIIENTITNISVLQQPNNELILDFWDKDLKNHMIYNGMISFYKEKMKLNEDEINLFNINDIESAKLYETTESTDVFAQELILTDSKTLNDNREICLLENYVRLTLKNGHLQKFV